MRTRIFLTVMVIISLWSGMASAQVTNMSITITDALTFTVNQPTFVAADSKKDSKDDLIQALASDHISVVSSRGYVVKAISGDMSGAGVEGLVHVTPLIGTTNKGNTNGITFNEDVQLPPANGKPVTLITAANCSWDGPNSTNKFNIAYKIGNKYAYIDKKAAPSIIPVIFTVTQP